MNSLFPVGSQMLIRSKIHQQGNLLLVMFQHWINCNFVMQQEGAEDYATTLAAQERVWLRHLREISQTMVKSVVTPYDTQNNILMTLHLP